MESWTIMLQSKTRSYDLETQSCNELYIKDSRSNFFFYFLLSISIKGKATDTINDNKPEKQHISKP